MFENKPSASSHCLKSQLFLFNWKHSRIVLADLVLQENTKQNKRKTAAFVSDIDQSNWLSSITFVKTNAPEGGVSDLQDGRFDIYFEKQNHN